MLQIHVRTEYVRADQQLLQFLQLVHVVVLIVGSVSIHRVRSVNREHLNV